MIDYATPEEEIKSLEDKVKSAKSAREKVDALIALAYELRGPGSQRANKLIDEAYDLAKSIGYEKGMGHSLVNKGLQYIYSAEFEAALNVYFEAQDIFTKINDTDGKGRILSHHGVIYRTVGDLDRAVQSFMDSLSLLDKSEKKNESEFKRTKAWSLLGLAGVYSDLKDFETALQYYRKSLELFKQADFKHGEAVAISGMGNVYQSINQNEKALDYHFQSLELNQSGKIKIGISRSFSDIGTCYENFGDYDKALEYNLKSLEIREQTGYRSAAITNLVNIGRIYIKTDKFEKADEFLQRALAESKAIDAKPKTCAANQLLADLFEKTGDYKKALSYYKEFYAFKEQVFSEESKFKLLNLQNIHKIETARKEAEIYHLKNIRLTMENERKSEELEQARTLQISMLPKKDICSDKIEIIGKMRTATEVGGDYYDFIDLGEEKYAAAIGDATGHGVGAGLVVGMIKMALTNALQPTCQILPTKQLLKNLNIALKKSMPKRGMGMGLGLAIIDVNNRKVELSFAGMPFPFLYHYKSKKLTAFEMRCPPLGFFDRIPVQTREVRVKDNDLLIFLSDGFEERMNPGYEIWGQKKLKQKLLQICRQETDVKKIAERLFNTCDEFAENFENQDDMTLVVIKFTASEF